MVVTGDRDMFQIVGDGVRVMATSRGITETKIYDRQAVIDRYGIPPELIPDFYGLKGDTSDNIPGVPGIGDKTASDLLQRFGDLDTVLGSIDDISGAKRKENLTNHADDARMSKELATIQVDVPVEIDVGVVRRPGARPVADPRDVPDLRAARPAAAPRGGARRGRCRASGGIPRGHRGTRRAGRPGRALTARRRAPGACGGAAGAGGARAGGAAARRARDGPAAVRRVRGRAETCSSGRPSRSPRSRWAGATGRSSRTTGSRSPRPRSRARCPRSSTTRRWPPTCSILPAAPIRSTSCSRTRASASR